MNELDINFEFLAKPETGAANVVTIEAGAYAPQSRVALLREDQLSVDATLPPVWLSDLDIAPTEVVPDDQIAFPDAGVPDDWMDLAEIDGAVALDGLAGEAMVIDAAESFDFADSFDGGSAEAGAAAGEAAAAEVSAA